MPRPLLVFVLMIRAIEFGAGALAFTAAHALERSHWSDWFHGVYEPWFLNSGRAAFFTIVVIFSASALITAVQRTRTTRGIATGAGASAAMLLALFTQTGGPGTIFPLVVVIGGGLVFGASVGGAWVVANLGRLSGAAKKH